MPDENTDTEEATEATTDDTTSTEDAGTLEETADKDEAWDPERARRKIAKLNSENKNLRERATKAPKPEDVTAKDNQIGTLSAENLRLRVGYELGLPANLVDRLKGTTREELVADAETLLELVAPAKRPGTRKPTEALRGGLEPDTEPEETDLKKLGERMFTR